MTYFVADKYLVKDLCEKLIEFIKTKISIENSVLIYDQFLELNLLEGFNLDKLTEIISLHAVLVLNSDFFLKINEKTLIELLGNNCLIIDEIDLFRACLKWINYQLGNQKLEINSANQKVFFDKIKSLLRFPIMSKIDFFGNQKQTKSSQDDMFIPFKSGLFTNKELDEFKQYFENRDPAVLSTNYNFSKRDGLKVGKFVYDWRTRKYQTLKADEELPETGNLVYKDADGHYVDDLIKQANQTNRFQRIITLNPEEQEQSNFNDHEEEYNQKKDEFIDEIKVFKMQKWTGNKDFEDSFDFKIYDYFGECLFDNEIINSSATYGLNRANYIAFCNSVPLIVNQIYSVECKSEHRNETRLKLEKLFEQTDDDTLINYKLQTISTHHRPCAFEIYFIYK